MIHWYIFACLVLEAFLTMAEPDGSKSDFNHSGAITFSAHAENDTNPPVGTTNNSLLNSVGSDKALGSIGTFSLSDRIAQIPTSGFISCDPDAQPSVCKAHLLEVCRQLNGEFRCLCPENFSRAPNGRCTVFNECYNRADNNCSVEAECIDQLEGYTCRCKAGFRDESPNVRTLPGRVCTAGSSTADLEDAKKDKIGDESITGQNHPGAISSPEFSLDSVSSVEHRKDISATAVGSGSQNEPSASVSTFTSGVSDPTATVVQKSGFSGGLSSLSAGDPRPTFGSSLAAALAETSGAGVTSESIPRTPSQFDTLLSAATSKVVDHDQRNLQSIDDTRPTTMSAGALRDIFRSFDTDNNELVSFFELKAAVELHGLQLTEDDVRKMMKIADSSGEGLVDFGEFTNLMKSA